LVIHYTCVKCTCPFTETNLMRQLENPESWGSKQDLNCTSRNQFICCFSRNRQSLMPDWVCSGSCTVDTLWGFGCSVRDARKSSCPVCDLIIRKGSDVLQFSLPMGYYFSKRKESESGHSREASLNFVSMFLLSLWRYKYR
jgi:hypothetical protein